MKRHIQCTERDRVLDIGCGVGAHARFFGANYTGIDVNPQYVSVAQKRGVGDFRVMDATRLSFPEGAYDVAVVVAMFHHLDDGQVKNSLQEAIRVLRPGGRLHVIDPILPTTGMFKRWIFLHDRGQHRRTFKDLEGLLRSCFPIMNSDTRSGVLHDVAYFEFVKGN